MNRKDIIRMAREAGLEMDDSFVLEPEVIWYISQEVLERLFHMAQAVEREACAKVCEETDDGTPYNLALQCAANILARGETK